MEVFVARQPIFTEKKEIFAYELLHRDNLENRYPEMNGDEATADVIINSFLNIGIDQLSNGKPCFINFTEKLLNLRLPTYFQPHEIVIEILETVELNQGILDVCHELKGMGYQIALDDFVINKNNPYSYLLLRLADIVKIDFRVKDKESRLITERMALNHNIKLLAEKIENSKEFESAVKIGYQYFQGYYFSKPAILSTRDIPEYFHSYNELIYQLSIREPDLDYITEIFERDLSLSYKLLKLINSPAFRPIVKISSIRQAIVLLGFNEIRKWIFLLSMRENSVNKNDVTRELTNISLTRAKMSERIALHINNRKEAPAYFLTGMFSLIDVLLETDMDTVLGFLPLQENICDALKGNTNPLKDALDLCIAIESGNWAEADQWCKKLNIDRLMAYSYYHESLIWSYQIMKE